jgi:cysteine-rich repeat protein
VVLVGSARVAQAGVNVWTSTGPGGSLVYALAIDPTTPARLYAGTDRYGLFTATDGGSTWRAAGLQGRTVTGIAIDSTNPATLYAGTDNGVFKSADGAGTWIGTGLVKEVICGDGVVGCDEPCDDGNPVNGDGCDANCTPSACGNGVVSASEECDDGNPETFDFCDALHGCQHGRPCAGDCGRNREVTVDELLTMVNITLGTAPAYQCPAGDGNQDGTITINEIITAVNVALNGCGGG